MKKLSLFVIAFLFSLINLTAQIKILSPIAGTWANKQMLVIENQGEGDYFYSLDGSDPESFGFAYDGPVLIDLTDKVNLKVTFVSKTGKKEDASVSYEVKLDDGQRTSYKDFVKSFYKTGVYSYSSGAKFNIPSKLQYSFGLPPDSFLQGSELTLSEKSVLLRNLPCTIYDPEKNIKYRFIVKTFPQNAGIYSKREVPFVIEDWNTITFTNQNLLYKIDSEYWGLPKEARVLDRSVSHMISWQNLDYTEGNPVEFFVLPPKPQIEIKKNDDGSVLYTINGDEAYTMSVFSKEKNDYMELFPEIGADVFFGDKASGLLDIGVFANSVYQGKIIAQYEIDKRPPSTPVITSSAKSFYSKSRVKVEVEGDPGADLYVALSQPYLIPESENIYKADSEIFKNVEIGEYKKVKSSKYGLYWNPRNSGPAYYKLSAYTQSGKNKSKVVEYSLILDQSSYYYDQSANSEEAEGTIEHPFTSFSQCLSQLEGVRAVTLRVKGDLNIDEECQLEANYEIINNGDARIIFGPQAGLSVKSSSLEISDCRILNQISSGDLIKPLIKLENAVLTLKNSTLAINFEANGNVIDAYNSIVNISDTIASANALKYLSFISSVKTRLSIKKSQISTSAETSVIISANEGNLNASENEFTVSGKAGRVAELFKVRAKLTSNTFKGQLNSENFIEPVYTNSPSNLVLSENESYGF
ncbi:MAG: hypothetical protein K6C97_07230 [Treponema sp.]|nr:hypothetical protein [Treponema sp.]